MKKYLKLTVLSALLVVAGVATSQSQVLVYDNLATAASAGYSQVTANNPVFGDALTLTQGGVLSQVGLSIFNSSSGGNTGSILTGTMLVSFYDNTTPYSGGALSNPLLGTATVAWDFTADGGLAPGYYSTDVFDVSAANITLPQNILITQRFTLTGGTSLRNGVILFADPTTGSSPNTVYIFSATTSEGLYTFTGNAGQFGYRIEVVPEPALGALAGMAVAAALIFRRRQ